MARWESPAAVARLRLREMLKGDDPLQVADARVPLSARSTTYDDSYYSSSRGTDSVFASSRTAPILEQAPPFRAPSSRRMPRETRAPSMASTQPNSAMSLKLEALASSVGVFMDDHPLPPASAAVPRMTYMQLRQGYHQHSTPTPSRAAVRSKNQSSRVVLEGPDDPVAVTAAGLARPATAPALRLSVPEHVRARDQYQRQSKASFDMHDVSMGVGAYSRRSAAADVDAATLSRACAERRQEAQAHKEAIMYKSTIRLE